MPYHQAPPKPDNPVENKFFFLCQTRGCGDVINPEFPVADKKPSPKNCKNHQTAEARAECEQEWDERNR
ncbi:MAG TPA: hypothetical protein VGF82_08065 [Terracidiphilus sp.]|jgi:hypothetical protein